MKSRHRRLFKNVHPDPHMMVGQKIYVKSADPDMNGRKMLVQDWWDRIYGDSWMRSKRAAPAVHYAVRGLRFGLPNDNEVLVGKIGFWEVIIHASEVGKAVNA